MKLIPVQLPARPAQEYAIAIKPGLLGEIGAGISRLARCRSVAVISDSNVGPLYGKRAMLSLAEAEIRGELLTFRAGEEHKTVATCARLWDSLAEMTIERATPIIALGGGVVGDVAGFVSACFLRGLPVVQVPTTLLACVDSSVGGKTGVDHPKAGKNSIGAFHQPIGVLIDPLLLASLPGREWSCGLAESVKHGVILDGEFLDWLDERAEALARLVRAPAEQTAKQVDMLCELIAANCRIKASVVAADEREAGLRAVLNFGHTVGHAIETLAGFGRLRHGEAVSIGMAVATRLGVARGLAERGMLDRLVSLLARLGLPTTIPPDMPAERIIALTAKDKKVRDGKVRFVLPAAAGKAQIVDDVSEAELAAAIGAS